MGYTHRVDLEVSYGEAVEQTKQALAEEGFGIVYELNMKNTLAQKIGVDAGEELGDYLILGACIPTLAQRALMAEPSMGALLPCNVVVRASGESSAIVEAIDTTQFTKLSDHPQVKDMTEDANQGLHAVMARLKG